MHKIYIIALSALLAVTATFGTMSTASACTFADIVPCEASSSSSPSM